jgi:hypothetical protein
MPVKIDRVRELLLRLFIHRAVFLARVIIDADDEIKLRFPALADIAAETEKANRRFRFFLCEIKLLSKARVIGFSKISAGVISLSQSSTISRIAIPADTRRLEIVAFPPQKGMRNVPSERYTSALIPM